MNLHINDNYKGQILKNRNCDDKTIASLNKIANKKLSDLANDNPNLLVFPNNLKDYKDKIGSDEIFGLKSDKTITTGNIMGFIGIDDVQLNIGSRFDENKEKQYFLQYMLQKVFSINLIDLQTKANNENIWDILLIYMFPYYLSKALQQGLYKEYQKRRHNDANVKGAIDVVRHIKNNIPFMGKIAYNTREFSFDNPVIQLIRHTIEYIAHRGYSKALTNNWETQRNVQIIRQASKNYSINNRQKICLQNSNNIKHPFFTEYEPLRKIALQILRRKGVALSNSKEKVHGVLFDGAWLWEEYLNTILKEKGFKHPEDKKSKGGLNLFKGGGRKIYPDFYSVDKSTVIDAKYKNMPTGYARDDLYQLITYMYRLKMEKGVFMYPSESQQNYIFNNLHEESYGSVDATVGKYAVGIPQSIKDYNEFIKKIEKEEKLIKNNF